MAEPFIESPIAESEVNNEQVAEKTNGVSSGTQEIPINLKELPNDKIRLNFNKGVGAGEFIKRPTQTEVNRTQLSSQPSPEINQTISSGISKLDAPSSSNFTESVDPAYFEDIAEGITWVIDLIATWLLAKFALDPNVNSTPYKIQKEKIDRLKVVMGKILAQMKTKFPLGWLFFMMLVACYAGSFTKAYSTRNENLKIRKDEAEKKALKLKEKKAEENNSNPQRTTLKQKIKTNSHRTETVPFKELVIPEEADEEVEIKMPEKPQRKIIKINKAQYMKGLSGSTKRKVEVPDEEEDDIPQIPPSSKKRGGNFKN